VPRAGQVKSSGERLSDRVAIGVLTRAFPAHKLVQADEDTVRDVVHRFNQIGPACLDP
jgi:hypothetical protein